MNELLLIEDDATDVLFFERALAEAGGGVLLKVAEDAEEAVSRLRRWSCWTSCCAAAPGSRSWSGCAASRR